MPLLFFLASNTRAVRVYLLVFINVTLQCIKFLLASLLKECSVFLSVYSVANKTFTYMRNVEGKRGAVLDIVQSCDQKHTLLTCCKFCVCYVHQPMEIPFLLASNVWQQKMLFCSCSVLLPPTAPFLPPPFFSAFLGVEIVERAFSKAPFCQPALIILKKRISL